MKSKKIQNVICSFIVDTEMAHDALNLNGSIVLKNRTALRRFEHEGELNGALIYFLNFW